MKKSILFLAPYPLDKAPSQRLKYEQYYDAIEKAGYEIETKSFISEKFWSFIYKEGKLFSKFLYTIGAYFKRWIHLFSLRKYDIVYIHLWVTPFGLPMYELIALMLAKKVVYDIDDMIFLGHASKANKLVGLIKGKSKIHYLLKYSNHVITCTPMLDEYARQFNQQTTDISSTIDTDIYKIEQRELNTPIILGWSGSYSTSKYLKLLEPMFLQLQESLDFKVLVIGDENFSFKNPSIKLETLPWELKNEVANLNRIDIGLYPLPDEPWVYGKSGLKALQYMALGKPTLAQNLKGANQRIIQSGENGFLVSEIQDWIDSILLLVENEEIRNKVSINARKTVDEKYSIHATKSVYLDILNSL